MWQEWDLPYYGSPPKYTKQKQQTLDTTNDGNAPSTDFI